MGKDEGSPPEWRIFTPSMRGLDRKGLFQNNGCMAYLVFRQLIVMTLICVIGYLLAKWKHFGEKESQFLSYLLLYVVTPCLIIDTYNVPFDGEKLTHFLIMLGLSTLTFMLLILFSSLLFGKPKSEADDRTRSLDKMIIVYSNAGYIGIPIISAVLGQEAVFYLMVYILIFNTVLWIHGQYLMTRTISLKAVLTKPAVLASAFSILLFLSPWKLPYVVGSTVHLFATYLLDILAEIKGDNVELSFSDGSSPSIIRDTADSAAIYVLMPMRV
ncbi:MAG: AEC family transporter [Oribacterium sp.]|nr:AEC family transporter [Oribacterium sp.]